MTVELHVFKNDVLEKRAYTLILPEVFDEADGKFIQPPDDDYILGTGDIPFYGFQPYEVEQGHITRPMPGKMTLGDFSVKFVESKKQDVLYWYSAWSRRVNNGSGVYGYYKDYVKPITVKWVTYFGVRVYKLTVFPKSISGYAVDNASGFIEPTVTFGVVSSTLYLGVGKGPMNDNSLGSLLKLINPKIPSLDSLPELKMPKL